MFFWKSRLYINNGIPELFDHHHRLNFEKLWPPSRSAPRKLSWGPFTITFRQKYPLIWPDLICPDLICPDLIWSALTWSALTWSDHSHDLTLQKASPQKLKNWLFGEQFPTKVFFDDLDKISPRKTMQNRTGINSNEWTGVELWILLQHKKIASYLKRFQTMLQNDTFWEPEFLQNYFLIV